eukprot:3942938-Pyramimonas_sp.AAC.1
MRWLWSNFLIFDRLELSGPDKHPSDFAEVQAALASLPAFVAEHQGSYAAAYTAASSVACLRGADPDECKTCLGA